MKYDVSIDTEREALCSLANKYSDELLAKAVDGRAVLTIFLTGKGSTIAASHNLTQGHVQHLIDKLSTATQKAIDDVNSGRVKE